MDIRLMDPMLLCQRRNQELLREKGLWHPNQTRNVGIQLQTESEFAQPVPERASEFYDSVYEYIRSGGKDDRKFKKILTAIDQSN